MLDTPVSIETLVRAKFVNGTMDKLPEDYDEMIQLTHIKCENHSMVACTAEPYAFHPGAKVRISGVCPPFSSSGCIRFESLENLWADRAYPCHSEILPSV